MRLHIFCFVKLYFNYVLFFSDKFPEEGFWVDLPGFCLIECVADFFHGELLGLSEDFFEVGIIKEGVAHRLDEVRAL